MKANTKKYELKKLEFFANDDLLSFLDPHYADNKPSMFAVKYNKPVHFPQKSVESHRNLSQLGTCYADINLSEGHVIFGDINAEDWPSNFSMAKLGKQMSVTFAVNFSTNTVRAVVFKERWFSNKLARFVRS